MTADEPIENRLLNNGALVTFEALGYLGRFGNQLFQIAATIGVARQNRCPVGFSPWPYEAAFAGRLPRLHGPVPPRRVMREMTFHYTPIAIREPTQLAGFFQSEKYFVHCADEIRALFAPSTQNHRALEEFVRGRLRGSTCSIHVRRGDYVTHPGYAKPFETDYYQRAMQQFPDDTTFVVFSDDPAWCQQRFHGPRFAYLQGLNAMGDFFAMTACTHHIIANSSFSWWAAWLNPKPDKRVIAPQDWYAGDYADPNATFVAGPPHCGFHDTRDLIPTSWLRI